MRMATVSLCRCTKDTHWTTSKFKSLAHYGDPQFCTFTAMALGPDQSLLILLWGHNTEHQDTYEYDEDEYNWLISPTFHKISSGSRQGLS